MLIKKVFLALSLSAVFAYGSFTGLTPKQLEEKIKKNVVVIDIRTPPEWVQTGVVPSSKKIMFFDAQGGYDVNKWMIEFSKHITNKKQEFVLVCRSGNRTGTVGNFLSKQLGFENVFHLQNGIKSWIKEGKKTQN